MATSNFHNKNASYTFVGLLENEWDYDDLKENLRDALMRNENLGQVHSCDDMEKDGLRSYGGTIIATVESKEKKQYQDFEVYFYMEVIVRGGYYEHCNVDWNMYFSISGDTFPLDEDVENALWGYVDHEGMIGRYAEWIQNWITNNQDEFRVEVEKSIAEHTSPYGVSARFSNGETWYKKVEKVEF